MAITTILISILLSNFGTFASSTPELCDIPNLAANGSVITDAAGRHLARYCEWTGPDAPLLDSEVCCEVDETGAGCSLPDARGDCGFGERYSCEYGEVTAFGGVVCYQPFPDACDAGFCVAAPELPPGGEAFEMLCCNLGGICQFVDEATAGDCDGEFVACDWGIENADGTVECFD